MSSRFVGMGAALALVASVAACTVGLSTASDAERGPDRPYNTDDGGDGAFDPTALAPDAGSGGFADAGASLFLGNPLCNARSADCFPDDALSCVPTTTPDAGATPGDDAAAAPPTAPPACRVAKTASGVKPTCEAGGTGTDGDPCTKGADCAAGFECVGSTTGQCRHYCCDMRTCAKDSSGHQYFCDVQSETEVTDTKVPACLPVQECKLLMSRASCSDKETCGIVDDHGTTSCVDIGNARAGESCEVEHCGADLVCIGAIGARVCWQLCTADNPTQCAPYQKCKTGGPLLPDPSVGVCTQ